MPASIRRALKQLALDNGTTMSELVRTAIVAGVQKPIELAEASTSHHRTSTGVRTSVDVPRRMHRMLKRLAAERDTSVQALIFTAIVRKHPEITNRASSAQKHPHADNQQHPPLPHPTLGPASFSPPKIS
jgi:hypothetical protein